MPTLRYFVAAGAPRIYCVHDSREEAVILFGPRDQFLRTVRDALGVKVVARGDTLQLEGTEEQVDHADRAFGQLRGMLRKNGRLTPEDVRSVKVNKVRCIFWYRCVVA